jgi:putative oxidoreductase
MDVGLLLLRLTVGLTLAGHGAQKWFGWFGGYGPAATGQFLEQLGFRPGRRHAVLAGVVEVAAGALLALGFLTPLGAALGLSVMIVAAATVHFKNGFFATAGGYEYNLLLGVAALTPAFTGPGAVSLDNLLGYSVEGTIWGIAAIAIAVIGAVAQLAQRDVPALASATPAAS